MTAFKPMLEELREELGPFYLAKLAGGGMATLLVVAILYLDIVLLFSFGE